VDLVRLLGGGLVRSVTAHTGNWDAERPTEGAYSALLSFEGGAFASMSYSGYGHFDSDAWMDGINEMGFAKPPGTHGAARARLRGVHDAAQVDADTLLAAALRLRPDRILLGELRGREAFAFMRAVNSGHPGSITTVHADSPLGALDQIALLALTSGVDLGWDKVQAYISRVVDIVVQLDRTGGSRRMTEVLFRSRQFRRGGRRDTD
jgi:hypothetical protein